MPLRRAGLCMWRRASPLGGELVLSHAIAGCEVCISSVLRVSTPGLRQGSATV